MQPGKSKQILVINGPAAGQLWHRGRSPSQLYEGDGDIFRYCISLDTAGNERWSCVKIDQDNDK